MSYLHAYHDVFETRVAIPHEVLGRKEGATFLGTPAAQQHLSSFCVLTWWAG